MTARILKTNVFPLVFSLDFGLYDGRFGTVEFDAVLCTKYSNFTLCKHLPITFDAFLVLILCFVNLLMIKWFDKWMISICISFPFPFFRKFQVKWSTFFLRSMLIDYFVYFIFNPNNDVRSFVTAFFGWFGTPFSVSVYLNFWCIDSLSIL